MIRELEEIDLFVSKAAAEVLRMYKQDFGLPKSARIVRATTASAAPVGLFYYGTYHTLVLAPATSNTVAKCVFGISDNLATNVFAQAGKCRVPTIVFASRYRASSKPRRRRHGSGLSAPHRPREYRAAEVVRRNAGGRVP
jgi:flavoprotein